MATEKWWNIVWYFSKITGNVYNMDSSHIWSKMKSWFWYPQTNQWRDLSREQNSEIKEKWLSCCVFFVFLSQFWEECTLKLYRGIQRRWAFLGYNVPATSQGHVMSGQTNINHTGSCHVRTNKHKSHRATCHVRTNKHKSHRATCHVRTNINHTGPHVMSGQT